MQCSLLSIIHEWCLWREKPRIERTILQPGKTAAIKLCDITWHIYTATLKQVKADSCLSSDALHDTVLSCTVHLTNNNTAYSVLHHVREVFQAQTHHHNYNQPYFSLICLYVAFHCPILITIICITYLLSRYKYVFLI
jgi:hypothetical protein